MTPPTVRCTKDISGGGGEPMTPSEFFARPKHERLRTIRIGSRWKRHAEVVEEEVKVVAVCRNWSAHEEIVLVRWPRGNYVFALSADDFVDRFYPLPPRFADAWMAARPVALHTTSVVFFALAFLWWGLLFADVAGFTDIISGG